MIQYFSYFYEDTISYFDLWPIPLLTLVEKLDNFKTILTIVAFLMEGKAATLHVERQPFLPCLNSLNEEVMDILRNSLNIENSDKIRRKSGLLDIIFKEDYQSN